MSIYTEKRFLPYPPAETFLAAALERPGATAQPIYGCLAALLERNNRE